MGSLVVSVNPSREVDGNMKWNKKVEDSSVQMRDYMKHNADFQRHLMSVRESRALLEKTHKLRKERASHMGFQFKQITWQMRRAQDDAYLAQGRYLKLLQLEGVSHLSFTKEHARVEDEGHTDKQPNQVAEERDCQVNQDTQNEHQNSKANSQHESKCQEAPFGIPADQYPTRGSQQSTSEDGADLDCLHGTKFQIFTNIEENNHTIVGQNYYEDQQKESYLILTNNNKEVSRGEKLLTVAQQELRQDIQPRTPTKSSNEFERDDFVSTSLFVCGNLDCHDSQEVFLEQRTKAASLLDSRHKDGEQVQSVLRHDGKQNQDEGQGISQEQESTDDGNQMKNCESDLPVSIMPTTPRMTASTPWVTACTKDEVVVEDLQAKRSEVVAKKESWKIEKNDSLSQKIAKELDDFTHNASLGCSISKTRPITEAGDSCVNKIDGASEAESILKTTNVKAKGETVKRKVTHRQVELSGLTTEENREMMKGWYPLEKLGVLVTITNTMFLWDLNHSSSQEQDYGNWPECEPLVSAAHAAKGGQKELFEFMETVGENTARPMICCGAVCELLKAYPPENLLPFRFIEDFFAYASKEGNRQRWSKRPVEGLTFDHLEVYQEEQHTHFWHMLVHHVVSVKDHNLASFTQIAVVFVEILLPSTRMQDFPSHKVKDLQEDLLQFFVTGFRSKNLHLFRVQYEECTGAQMKLHHAVSKDFEDSRGSLHRCRAAIPSQLQKSEMHKDAKGFSPGHNRSRRSWQLRRVSSRKGVLSRFRSSLQLLQANFKIWRLKALSRGIDTVDDAVVCLLRREQEATHS